jgi:hypothetical protein
VIAVAARKGGKGGGDDGAPPLQCKLSSPPPSLRGNRRCLLADPRLDHLHARPGSPPCATAWCATPRATPRRVPTAASVHLRKPIPEGPDAAASGTGSWLGRAAEATGSADRCQAVHRRASGRHATQGGLQRAHICRRRLQLDLGQRALLHVELLSLREERTEPSSRRVEGSSSSQPGQWRWRLELEAPKRASASLLQVPTAHQQRAQERLVPAARAHPRRRAPGTACGARAAPAAPYRVRCVAARSSEQVCPQSSCTGTILCSEALICALLCAYGAASSDAAVATVVQWRTYRVELPA